MADYKERAKDVWQGAKEGAKKGGERASDFASEKWGEVKEFTSDKKFEMAGGILNANPKSVLSFFRRKYEQKRREDLNQDLKTEPKEEERKRKNQELDDELKIRREREDSLRKDEKEHRKKVEDKFKEESKQLEEDLKAEPDEERKKERREQLKKDQEKIRNDLEEILIKNREEEGIENQQMTLIDGEIRTAGWAEREILRKRAARVADSGADISELEGFEERDRKRQEKLNELYKKKSDDIDKKPDDPDKLSEKAIKAINDEIDSLKKEVEKEALKVAATLSHDNLNKIGDVIDAFVDKKTKQEMPLNGEYKPIKLKWGGNEASTWEKQVRQKFIYGLKKTAVEMRLKKQSPWAESKFEKNRRDITIEPKKPVDEGILMKWEWFRNRAMEKYLEKSEWVNTRIEEYAKSQKVILEVTKRINEKIGVSLGKDSEIGEDPETWNLSALMKKHPEIGQDWLKIAEAMEYQKDIEKSFRLEVAEQQRAQIRRNTVKQDLGDFVYRNHADFVRSMTGPLQRLWKGVAPVLSLKGLKGGALISGKDLASFVYQFFTAGAEWFLKETVVSPSRFLIKLAGGGGREVYNKIRKNMKNKKIEEKIGKGLNT